MADKNDMWEDNVGGFVIESGKKVSFYVDRECILCSVCTDAAPKNFKVSDDGDHDYVYKQPENEVELDSCYEAMECCPVEAIGCDGAD
jgi:ferredoxin